VLRSFSPFSVGPGQRVQLPSITCTWCILPAMQPGWVRQIHNRCVFRLAKSTKQKKRLWLPVRPCTLTSLEGWMATKLRRGGLPHLLIDFGQTMEATLLHLAVSHFKNGHSWAQRWAQRWGHFLWETIPGIQRRVSSGHAPGWELGL